MFPRARKYTACYRLQWGCRCLDCSSSLVPFGRVGVRLPVCKSVPPLLTPGTMSRFADHFLRFVRCIDASGIPHKDFDLSGRPLPSVSPIHIVYTISIFWYGSLWVFFFFFLYFLLMLSRDRFVGPLIHILRPRPAGVGADIRQL